MLAKSIRLVSNNICYGPAPAPTDEVEQRLTILSDGRVWFSAHNYNQYLNGKGSCRTKRVNIGVWKAGFLLSLLGELQDCDDATDVGSFSLTIRYCDGSEKELFGPLTGSAFARHYGDTLIDVTRILRRYVPVYALWGFNMGMSPDYEGKRAIYLFSSKWLNFFSGEAPNYYKFEEQFGSECTALGFQMDCGKEFCRTFPGAFTLDNSSITECISSVHDIDLLGSALFSQWRYLTHWANYSILDEKVRQWYCISLARLKELTKKA